MNETCHLASCIRTLDSDTYAKKNCPNGVIHDYYCKIGEDLVAISLSNYSKNFLYHNVNSRASELAHEAFLWNDADWTSFIRRQKARPSNASPDRLVVNCHLFYSKYDDNYEDILLAFSLDGVIISAERSGKSPNGPIFSGKKIIDPITAHTLNSYKKIIDLLPNIAAPSEK